MGWLYMVTVLYGFNNPSLFLFSPRIKTLTYIDPELLSQRRSLPGAPPSEKAWAGNSILIFCSSSNVWTCSFSKHVTKVHSRWIMQMGWKAQIGFQFLKLIYSLILPNTVIKLTKLTNNPSSRKGQKGRRK